MEYTLKILEGILEKNNMSVYNICVKQINEYFNKLNMKITYGKNNGKEEIKAVLKQF